MGFPLMVKWGVGEQWNARVVDGGDKEGLILSFDIDDGIPRG